MAMKMRLVIPPLPIDHNKEISIFNEFMKNEAALNQSNIMNLCEIFKGKAYGKCVLPKLPCLLKTFHKLREPKSLLKLVQISMKYKVNDLLNIFEYKKICLN